MVAAGLATIFAMSTVGGRASAQTAWPSDVQQAFLSGCTQSGQASLGTCTCMMDQLESVWSAEQLTSLTPGSVSNMSPADSQALMSALLACAT
jgi:hypothetical protein